MKPLWKARKYTKAELSEYRTPAVCGAVRKIKCPQAARLDEMLGQMQEGVLLLEQPLNLAEVSYLFFHARMPGIKEIKFKTWQMYDPNEPKIKRTRGKLAKYLGIKPPEDLFRLRHFWNGVGDCLGFPIDVELMGFQHPLGTIGSCLFPGAKAWQPSADTDILKMRYAVAPPNYIPTFLYGSDRVTQGFVYDLQEQCWSSRTAFCGDGDFHARKNLWETLYYYLDISGLDSNYGFNAALNTWEQLESACCDDEIFDTWSIQIWALNLILTGFLNFNVVENIKCGGETAARYGALFSLPEKFANNRKVAVIATYPMSFLEIKDNFHPRLTKADIELLIGQEDMGSNEIAELTSKLSADAAALIFRGRKPETAKKTLGSIVEFAVKEIQENRPWLAVGLAFMLWESMQKDHTSIAMKIAEHLPQAIVPRFIRLAFKEHGRTRFDSHMEF